MLVDCSLRTSFHPKHAEHATSDILQGRGQFMSVPRIGCEASTMRFIFSYHMSSPKSIMSLFSWPKAKLTSNGVALYNFQSNRVAPLLPWTTVALRNTMAIANRTRISQSHVIAGHK